MTSNSNPNNYVGATASVVGYVAGEARKPAYDKDGTSGVLEISIPINEGYRKDGEFVQTGTTWYTYSAAGDYAARLQKLNKGDKIRIDDAKLEVREYQKKDGEKALGHSLRYGDLTVLEESNAPASSSDGFTPDATGGGFA